MYRIQYDLMSSSSICCRDAFQSVSRPPKITNLVLLFGDENKCLNPLSASCMPDSKATTNKSQATTLTGLALASVEFESEVDAQLFWSWSAAGRIKIYGHTLGATPDPSGFRVLGEVRHYIYYSPHRILQNSSSYFTSGCRW